MRSRTRAVWLGVGLLAVAPAAFAAEVPRPEHPEPGAVRAHWSNLNGTWDFRFDPDDKGRAARWSEPGAEGFDQKIVVPFCWESELSGIRKPDVRGVAWYRRTFEVPSDFPKDQRVWLHFGAVDEYADVWVNGTHVVSHEGGYTPFSADITEALKPGAAQTVVVRAFDPTDPNHPTGKQVGWYTRTSGIWQTVWLEARPKVHIAGFAVRTTIDPAEATFDVELSGESEGTLTIRSDDPTVGTVSAKAPAGARRVAVKVPVRQPKLWTPDTPHLYDVSLEWESGNARDVVRTYFGLRTIARGRIGNEPFERIFLNGTPIYLLGALDQSFNPLGIYTAPSDEFLRKDIELAKSTGLNMLRIHIKPEEPRRLYWADKLGMMILEDMPNSWLQSPEARRTWEHTMREAIRRDRNHPSIVTWVAFNETWGLGDPPRYKADRSTQDWVGRMVQAIREFDPTRLVEDNSPCNYDHVENTDLNSWHFYIDDYEAAKRHIEQVVAETKPGSGFNYCPGRVQGTAPLINSEYGGVSAGGGDRDVSWCFRDLTTQLRKQPKIQGYVYTELTDIEWEHNGFADYDRGAKVFGYDAFVPGMTIKSLQGPDFVGFDAPPAVVAAPGATLEIPIFVSHYSQARGPAHVEFGFSFEDIDGSVVRTQPRKFDLTLGEVGVIGPRRESVVIPELTRPAVGAVMFRLMVGGKEVAANYMNVVVRPAAPEPRLERRQDGKGVVVRFRPEEYARAKWMGGPIGAVEGKAYGRGSGSFEYRLKLPEAVRKAGPTSITLTLEAASKGGRDQVDWRERVNAQDYPQTDAREIRSTLAVSVNGVKAEARTLADDRADARGVLSHLARVEHGSFGEPLKINIDLPDKVRAALADGAPLTLLLEVPADASAVNGLCVFGATTGRYPNDPRVEVRTEQPVDNLNADPAASLAVDTVAARREVLVPAGDRNAANAVSWAYTTQAPDAKWADPDFDDSAWKRGAGGFGTEGTPAVRVRTRWDSPAIWLRASVDLPAIGEDDTLLLRVFHDEDVEVLVNGKRVFRARDYVTKYRDIPLDPGLSSAFRPGRNVIAVHCRQTGGGQGVDVGLARVRGETP